MACSEKCSVRDCWCGCGLLGYEICQHKNLKNYWKEHYFSDTIRSECSIIKIELLNHGKTTHAVKIQQEKRARVKICLLLLLKHNRLINL